TSALGSITPTVTRPPPVPFAFATAYIFESVAILIAPVIDRSVPAAPPAAMSTPSRTYARVVPETVAVGYTIAIAASSEPLVLSAFAYAVMVEPLSTMTAPEPTLTVPGVMLEADAACAPMNASTRPETVALATSPETAPKRPICVASVVASAYISDALAMIFSEPALTVPPSPTYARVLPLTSALGCMIATAPTRPNAAPSASA